MKFKFCTGIREHIARGDGRDTNEHRFNSHAATDFDISETRDCRAQEASETPARYVGGFDRN